MKTHKIVLLPGDGIGPEITEATTPILEFVSAKYDFNIEFKTKLIGGSAIEAFDNPLPDETLQACKSSDAVLLAAIGNPKFDELPRESRPESGLLKLRSGLNLFANIRPVKIFPSLISASTLKPEIVEKVDLIVVRELTGGIYFGKPKGRISSEEGERAFNTMSYSSVEIDRIAKIAFELAKDRKGKVCSIDKANVLDVSQLWRDRVNEIQLAFRGIELTHQYVDNAAMQLVRKPDQFDVILTGNLFGDIISDEAAMITGSIGMLPSASLSSDGPGMFEPVHGSAPDIANKNLANPIAMILSASMMLRIALKEFKAAQDIEDAIDNVLAQGYRTKDLASDNSNPLGCKEMGKKILENLSLIK
ncbi:3-isopropylmalate dehydrogenase [Prochlorococcus sp. MIT 0601]|uniref:3-isopropylmalate dehydrogenase n=1 Tax=Prochlorococcus sp. MIT 0601 TaxID=1499498 RepID=UPI000533737A|nr:3-isopropylmalate dehydrogenase [Prochlorococcus sp. MIT 0601]KGG12371.1 3-isopropylmalate dehydrogenase [Prochlorococcus sp. MIT 0601]